jgi:hypothetical protein
MIKHEKAVEGNKRIVACSTVSWNMNWLGWCAIRTIP